MGRGTTVSQHVWHDKERSCKRCLASAALHWQWWRVNLIENLRKTNKSLIFSRSKNISNKTLCWDTSTCIYWASWWNVMIKWMSFDEYSSHEQHFYIIWNDATCISHYAHDFSMYCIPHLRHRNVISCLTVCPCSHLHMREYPTSIDKINALQTWKILFPLVSCNFKEIYYHKTNHKTLTTF
jgi:hypothetical protein